MTYSKFPTILTDVKCILGRNWCAKMFRRSILDVPLGTYEDYLSITVFFFFHFLSLILKN